MKPARLPAVAAAACALVPLVDFPLAAGEPPPAVAGEIRAEAVRANAGDAGRPLPLAAHWNTGSAVGKSGFTPAYQWARIEEGHHLLPWFAMPDPNAPPGTYDREWWADHYRTGLRRAAAARLPISFVGTQWECLLSARPYLDLPPEQNPNVIGTDGAVRPEVCPFGPVEPWREVGRRWTSTAVMAGLQDLYPDPPRVVFVSNNEHAKQRWPKLEESRRYLDLHGKGRDEAFKRKVVADGWIERYRALEAGMRDGLVRPAWKERTIFVGYEAFGPAHFGRWDGWMEYSLCVPGRIDPSPLFWDGGSPSFYVHNWNPSTDYQVWSPQVESMNWVFLQREARRLNPEFWFEISTWDGHEPALENDKRKVYARLGQTFGPERYGGMVQFGLWLLRPRVVREFRGWTDTVEEAGPYFRPVLEAVDRPHRDPVLREFWRRGELVPNRARRHPYRSRVPAEYEGEDRWFLLDTDLDPKGPWTLGTEIPCFALALVKGKAPEREWLVYAHSPLAVRKCVGVVVPGRGAIRIDVEPAGSFWLVTERTDEVRRVGG